MSISKGIPQGLREAIILCTLPNCDQIPITIYVIVIIKNHRTNCIKYMFEKKKVGSICWKKNMP